jgi:hypothetical protein
MILHILTACSRPGNLPAWAADLAAIAGEYPGVDLRWHVGFDVARQHIGGQAVKNALLDSIPAADSGWVWIGDDDNALDTAMLEALAAYADRADVDAVVFAQRRRGCIAAPCAVVDEVDAAQIVARRAFIGDTRIPECYNGDGQWIATLAMRGGVVYDDRAVTRYNARHT